MHEGRGCAAGTVRLFVVDWQPAHRPTGLRSDKECLFCWSFAARDLSQHYDESEDEQVLTSLIRIVDC